MILTKEGATTIISRKKGALSAFVENIEAAYESLKDDNLIIDLLAYKELTPSMVTAFCALSKAHRASGKSFVLVTDTVSINELPEDDNIIVVPTTQEGLDMVEMEEIERDLGL